MFYICIQSLHDARGRRTRPAHQPESSHKPRTEEAPTSTEHGKPQAHGSGKASDGRKRGEVKTIKAKKPPIEALYPELPVRRPNKG